MHLFKRKNSPNYYIGYYDPLLKRSAPPKSTGTKNRREAQEILKQFELEFKEKQKNKSRGFITAQEIKLSDAFELFLEDRANTIGPYKKVTIQIYNRALNLFYDSVGNKNIELYTRNDYHKFVSTLADYQQNTKAKLTTRINSIFKWLVQENFLIANPVKKISGSGVREIHVPTKTEINSLLEYAKTTRFFHYTKFTLLSAFRLSEPLQITPNSIKKNRIYVDGKGSKYAYIPIIKPMRKFLKELPETEPDERYFKFTKSGVTRFFQRFRKKTGIRITCHDLRRFTLTEMANKIPNPKIVKDYARHGDIKTTLRYYAEADAEQMIKEIEKRDDLFNNLEL